MNATTAQPQARARATSGTTRATIDARLAALADRRDDQATREREYLEALRARKFPLQE